MSSSFSNFLNFTFLPLSLMIATPTSNILFWFICTHCSGRFTQFYSQYLQPYGILQSTSIIYNAVNPISSFVVYLVLGYFAWAIFWMKVLPGEEVHGPTTEKGNVPIYVDNGFKHFIISFIALATITSVGKGRGFTPTVVYDRFSEILIFMTVFSLLFCLVLYIKGRLAPTTSDNGHTGNFIFDYYWGTELYPRIFGIDVKVLTNCRFGMTVWGLLIFIFALKSYELYGFIDSIWVSFAIQFIYILKFFWWESGYMQTIDIIVDRAGYYICWGCLVWITGFYTLSSFYLVNNPIKLGNFKASLILIFGLTSIGLNYWADYQRQVVRATNGNTTIWGEKPKIIVAKYKTEGHSEGKTSILLVSGFWGMARHFNYVPELMLAFSWCAPALTTSLMPYLYFFFLTILLVHRTYRDDEKCSRKYGRHWQEYCRAVPYKMIPYIF